MSTGNHGATSVTSTTKRKRRLRKKNWVLSHNIPSAWHGPSPCTKSQGLTFSRVVIDFTGGVFAGGQAYVALSRCTSLEGIQLKKPISTRGYFVRPEIVSFSGRFNNRQTIDKALKQAQADVQYPQLPVLSTKEISRHASSSFS